jgi:NAD(P)-dependent dehydrogenase (short-subunit alcohol dehydrogenase family)
MLDLELQGKVALITGGSDGLGAGGCGAARGGARKLRSVRGGGSRWSRRRRNSAASGGEVEAIVADVTRAEDGERFVAEAVSAFGGVDIVLNNAGTSAASGLEESTMRPGTPTSTSS